MKKNYSTVLKIRLLDGDIIPFDAYGNKSELIKSWRKQALTEYYNSMGYNIIFRE